jgi:DNA-binding CsgD family transcriptional regulator
VLFGRTSEQRCLEELLVAARDGSSGTLVLVGDPGIGKTALLGHVAAQATGFRVLRTSGVESEADLPFASLFELCRPLLDLLERLEQEQAATLRAIFGLGPPREATGFAVGAAFLSLVAAAAEDQPLLLLVDDVHWLDSGSADALAFAVRRLRADAVAVVVATRPADGRPFVHRDLPELELQPLDADAARQLLGSAGTTSATTHVESVLTLAAGNPLALLELPRAGSVVEPAGQPVRLTSRLERAFATRAGALPAETGQALLVAAVADTTDVETLQGALAELGLDLQALEAAESARLVAFAEGTFAFGHPLVRSALYQGADPVQRRRAHAAVATALGDVDRAAWHLAAAAVGPDAAAAEALERAAASAAERSGFAAAAAALERAARLSATASERVRRLAAGADAAWLAGRTAQALSLVDEALAGAADPTLQGRLLHTRGTIEHFVGDAHSAHRTLEQAADLLAACDPRDACLCLIEAVGSALFTGEVERALRLGERAIGIAEAGQLEQELFACIPRGASLILAGRPAEAVPFLHRAAAAARGDLLEDDPRNLTWAALAGWWVADGELMAAKAGEAAAWARRHTALAALPWAATLLGGGLIVTGRWPEARAALTEGAEAGRLTAQHGHLAMVLAPLAWLDALEGRDDDCRARVAEGLALTRPRGLRWLTNWLLRALVLLELGRGVQQGAAPGTTELRRSLEELPLRETYATSSWPDLVEALVRTGEVAAAEAVLTPYAADAQALGIPGAMAVADRCRALVADDASFEQHFELALTRHAATSNDFETARTQQAYGERLRRAGQRVRAREQLHRALETFDRLGAQPWAERVRAELRASGERLRRGHAGPVDELTSQELQIALLVAEGRTNREAGAQLFLSPKTVEWHLGRVYGKLGVRSRTELSRVLLQSAGLDARQPSGA